jgi:hypoxanthine phosphoribosyltransferase
VSLKPDFVGFEIPDTFVVGYGLAWRDRYRNLPYLAALEPAEMQEDAAR